MRQSTRRIHATRTAPRARQTGISVIAAVLILVVVAAFGTVIARVSPHYLDNQTAVAIINALPPGRVHEMSKSDIHKTLEKRFKINNLRSLDVRRVVQIKRQKGRTSLRLDYERREPLVGNLHVVVSFQRAFAFS